MNTDPLDAGPRNAPSARGGVMLVSLYSWTCITLLAAAARFWIVPMHKQSYVLDDGLILVGSVIYTGATVASQYAVDGGLGRRLAEISAEDAMLFFKAEYAAGYLQIAAMACGKLSSACLLRRVAPQARWQDFVLFGMIGFWLVYSMLTFGFQCGVPMPATYSPANCGNGGPLFSIIGLNIVSDIVLAVWFFPTLRTLNMDMEARMTVATLFGARLLVPLAAIGQIWGLVKVIHGNDPTWDSYEFSLFSQTVCSLSLIVASLPRIKRFLPSTSGMGVAVIDETEIALAARGQSRNNSRAGNEPLKLIPSNSGKFTATIVSGKRSKEKHVSKPQSDWQRFISMGGKQDDQTSTSSLFDHRGGVMMQQEVTVKVEDYDPSRSDSHG